MAAKKRKYTHRKNIEQVIPLDAVPAPPVKTKTKAKAKHSDPRIELARTLARALLEVLGDR